MKSFIRNKKVDSHDVVNEILAWAERVKDKYASPLGPSTERALKAIKDGADINVSGRYGNTKWFCNENQPGRNHPWTERINL